MNDSAGLVSPLLQKIRFMEIRKNIRGNSLLDAGCGDRTLVKILDTKTFYLGVDVYPPPKSLSHKRKIKYLQLDLEKKFYLGRKFDTLVLSAVIEHLNDPSVILKNLARHMKKNGVMIITTPTKFGIKLHRLLSYFGITSREAAHEHTEGVDKESFIEFQKELGLSLLMYKNFLFGLNQLVVYKKLKI